MEQPTNDIADLVRQAQQGDRDAIAALFDRLHTRIYRYLILRTSNRETAEDLLQTTFLEMIRALPRYTVQSDTKFTTWLFQIARFRLIDYYRQQGRTVPLDDAPEMIAEQPEMIDPFDHARVDAALRTLPEKFQTVLHLRYREEQTTEEIAMVMKTTTINVRVIHHRALKALQQALPKV
jgi:RNA polymerase sigma-70 factor (ECF subfamily)